MKYTVEIFRNSVHVETFIYFYTFCGFEMKGTLVKGISGGEESRCIFLTYTRIQDEKKLCLLLIWLSKSSFSLLT